jgi:hypothetical protein
MNRMATEAGAFRAAYWQVFPSRASHGAEFATKDEHLRKAAIGLGIQLFQP